MGCIYCDILIREIQIREEKVGTLPVLEGETGREDDGVRLWMGTYNPGDEGEDDGEDEATEAGRATLMAIGADISRAGGGSL